jgi:hypothetical protein
MVTGARFSSTAARIVGVSHASREEDKPVVATQPGILRVQPTTVRPGFTTPAQRAKTTAVTPVARPAPTSTVQQPVKVQPEPSKPSAPSAVSAPVVTEEEARNSPELQAFLDETEPERIQLARAVELNELAASQDRPEADKAYYRQAAEEAKTRLVEYTKLQSERMLAIPGSPNYRSGASVPTTAEVKERLAAIRGVAPKTEGVMEYQIPAGGMNVAELATDELKKSNPDVYKALQDDPAKAWKQYADVITDAQSREQLKDNPEALWAYRTGGQKGLDAYNAKQQELAGQQVVVTEETEETTVIPKYTPKAAESAFSTLISTGQMPVGSKFMGYDDKTGQFSYELPPEKPKHLTPKAAASAFSALQAVDPSLQKAKFVSYDNETGQFTYEMPEPSIAGTLGVQIPSPSADMVTAKQHMGYISPDGKTFVSDSQATASQKKWVRALDPSYVKSVADARTAVIKKEMDKWLSEQLPTGATATVTMQKTGREMEAIQASDAAFSYQLKEFALNMIPGRTVKTLVKDWNNLNIYDQIGAVSGEVANAIMLGLIVKAPVGSAVRMARVKVPAGIAKMEVGLGKIDVALGKIRVPTATEVGVGLSRAKTGISGAGTAIKTFVATTPERTVYQLENATKNVVSVAKRAVSEAKIAPYKAKAIIAKLDKVALANTNKLIMKAGAGLEYGIKDNLDNLLVAVKGKLGGLSPAEIARVSNKMARVVERATLAIPEAITYKLANATVASADAVRRGLASELSRLKLAPSAVKSIVSKANRIAFNAVQDTIKNPTPTFKYASKVAKANTAKVIAAVKQEAKLAPAEIARLTRKLNRVTNAAVKDAFRTIPEKVVYKLDMATGDIARIAKVIGKKGALTVKDAKFIVSKMNRQTYQSINSVVRRYGGSLEEIATGKMTKQTGKALKYALQDAYKSGVTDKAKALKQYADDIRDAMRNADKATAIRKAQEAERLSATLSDKADAEQISKLFKKVRKDVAKSTPTDAGVAQVRVQVEKEVRATLNDLLRKTRGMKPSDVGRATPEMEAGAGVKAGTKPYKYGDTPPKPKGEPPPSQVGGTGKAPKAEPPAPKGGGVAVKEKTKTETKVKTETPPSKTKPMTPAEIEKLMKSKTKASPKGLPGLTPRSAPGYSPETTLGRTTQLEDVRSSRLPAVQAVKITAPTVTRKVIEVVPITTAVPKIKPIIKTGKAVGAETKSVTKVTPITVTQLGQSTRTTTSTRTGISQAVQAEIKTGIEAGVKQATQTGIKQGVKQAVKTGVKQMVKQEVGVKTLTKIPLRTFPLILLSELPDSDKRQLIKSSAGAFAWQQGQLRGKRVWHVVALVKGNWIRVIVLGGVPEGAMVVKPGKGQPQRSITLLYGLAPARTLRFPVGFVTAVITPSDDRKKVSIRFVVAVDYTPRDVIQKRQGRVGRGTSGRSRQSREVMQSVGGLKR